MSDRHPYLMARPLAAGLVAFAIIGGPAWGQRDSSSSSSHDQSKNNGEVIRTFGAEGGYRTEVASRIEGKLSGEDRRELSLLTAEVLDHIQAAREAIDGDDTREALQEVNKARQAIKAIRAMLPKAKVRIKTTAPDGKVVYGDEREVEDTRIPIYEGMLHARTLAPILAARRNAREVAGVTVVESETIATEVIADVDPIERQLNRAAKFLEGNKSQDAAKALALALVRGIEFRFDKDDSPLAAARDAVWLARRSLEENNAAQALANLAVARERLRIYREVAPQEQRQEVDRMLGEVDQLEAELRQEGTQQVTQAERSRQSGRVTHWWDRINSWFKRHF
jgi:hypothetical protein